MGGLGIDFNPCQAKAKRAPQAETVRRAAFPRPVRVQESTSRFTASEARPRPGAPRALKEEVDQARRIQAEVSRPPPAVRWIVPELDIDDGRAHPIPSGGPAGTADLDEAVEEARDRAEDSFERHRHESDYIRNTVAPRAQKDRDVEEQRIVDNFNKKYELDLATRDREYARHARERQAPEGQAPRQGLPTRASTRTSSIAPEDGQVERGGASHLNTGNVRRRGVAYPKPPEAPALAPPPTPARGAQEPPRPRLGAVRLTPAEQARAPASPGRTRGETPPASPQHDGSLVEGKIRERRLASAIDWRVEPHIHIPESGADDLHDELAGHLAAAEEELATMKRSSRLKTQLSEKVDYLKTQVARMAGKGGVHPLAADLQQLGLSADEADRARKLGFVLDGKNIKQHGQFRHAADLKRALENADAGAAGPYDEGMVAREKDLAEIGGWNAKIARDMAKLGYSCKQDSIGRVNYYTSAGGRITKEKVWEAVSELIA